MDAVRNVLMGVLDDLDAFSRRMAVRAADPRSDVDVDGEYLALDSVIELFFERMEIGVAGEDTRAGADDETRTRKIPTISAKKSKKRPTTEIATSESAQESLPLAEGDTIEFEDDDLLGAESLSDDSLEVVGDAPTRPVSRADVPAAANPDAHRKAAELLYEDVLWLFSINDGEGALVSLERLLMLGNLEGEAEEFLRLNGEKLLNLYEGYLGPFDKVPSRGETDIDHMPIGYLEHGLMSSILDMVDGKRSIQAIMQHSPFTPLETCAGIEQLRRARILEL